MLFPSGHPPFQFKASLMPGQSHVTGLLIDLRAGSEDATEHIFAAVYDELRSIAHRLLAAEHANPTLSTTGLVHEAYLRLVDLSRASWQDKAHFCAIAARAMRRILVDHARKRTAQKRGGRQTPLSLDEGRVAVKQQAALLIALDEALDRLSDLDHRLANVVEARFFGGMTEKEIAEVHSVSIRTVRRDWVKARAWLYSELKTGDA